MAVPCSCYVELYLVVACRYLVLVFYVKEIGGIPDMGLIFAGPDEGFELECDNCYQLEWRERWLDAGSLVVEAEGEGWEMEQLDKWDGVTYADARCPECQEGNDEDSD